MKPDLKRAVQCRDIEGNWHETTAETLQFRPSVYGVVIHEGKILLAKQKQGYDLPGGGIEKSEGITEALVREVKEETGIEVTVKELIACDSSLFKGSAADAFYHSIAIYYRCEVVGGELTMDNFDVYEKEYGEMPEWVSLDRLDSIVFCSSIDCYAVVRKALTAL